MNAMAVILCPDLKRKFMIGDFEAIPVHKFNEDGSVSIQVWTKDFITISNDKFRLEIER